MHDNVDISKELQETKQVRGWSTVSFLLSLLLQGSVRGLPKYICYMRFHRLMYYWTEECLLPDRAVCYI